MTALEFSIKAGCGGGVSNRVDQSRRSWTLPDRQERSAGAAVQEELACRRDRSGRRTQKVELGVRELERYGLRLGSGQLSGPPQWQEQFGAESCSPGQLPKPYPRARESTFISGGR